MKLVFYNKDSISHFISKRQGETKFGEEIVFVDSFEALETSSAKYVLFGIPEDIGVRANHGKPGASTAWKAFLPAFLNIQKNRFNTPKNCMLLGEIDCGDLMEKANSINPKEKDYHQKLGLLVSELDERVAATVENIHSSGKTPVIIGGGHNNAYGNIRGLSKSLGKPIDVLNIDAHTDLRKTDYRHSGNGFSFAMEEGFLNKYAVFGLHKNYTPEYILEAQEISKNIFFDYFEDMLLLSPQEKAASFQQSMDFLGSPFGLEIDCDTIENMESSAKTPSGFSLNEIRGFVQMAKKKNPLYLHLCEASARNSPLTGKALAYLVSDFSR